jgi:hypothetical protein
MVARRSVLLAVLIAVLVGAAVPAASVAGSSYSTTIVVSLKFPAFHGTLRSARSACSTGRTVKLYRERSGPDRLLGTDTSNAKTKWSIPIGKKPPAGSYYATTPAKGRCKPAKSNVIPIA